MPGRDGTGPNGMGSRTGRGLGFCQGTNALTTAAGYGFGGGGFGRGFGGRGFGGRGFCGRGFGGRGFGSRDFGGRGFGGRYWGRGPVFSPTVMTKQGLEEQASLLEAELEAVRRRIADQED